MGARRTEAWEAYQLELDGLIRAGRAAAARATFRKYLKLGVPVRRHAAEVGRLAHRLACLTSLADLQWSHFLTSGPSAPHRQAFDKMRDNLLDYGRELADLARRLRG